MKIEYSGGGGWDTSCYLISGNISIPGPKQIWKEGILKFRKCTFRWVLKLIMFKLFKYVFEKDDE